jgi:hypothetical protein
MRIALFVFAAFVTSCSGVDCVGDGTLVDNGMFSAQRYRLEFGQIDLSGRGEHKFVVNELPSEEFVFGFEVPNSKQSNIDFSKISIDFQVFSENDRVIRVNRDLGGWVKNISYDKVFFWCCQGRVGPDSYLAMDPGREYVISIKYESHDLVGPYIVEFIAEGGGWKSQ